MSRVPSHIPFKTSRGNGYICVNLTQELTALMTMSSSPQGQLDFVDITSNQSCNILGGRG